MNGILLDSLPWKSEPISIVLHYCGFAGCCSSLSVARATCAWFTAGRPCHLAKLHQCGFAGFT